MNKKEAMTAQEKITSKEWLKCLEENLEQGLPEREDQVIPESHLYDMQAVTAETHIYLDHILYVNGVISRDDFIEEVRINIKHIYSPKKLIGVACEFLECDDVRNIYHLLLKGNRDRYLTHYEYVCLYRRGVITADELYSRINLHLCLHDHSDVLEGLLADRLMTIKQNSSNLACEKLSKTINQVTCDREEFEIGDRVKIVKQFDEYWFNHNALMYHFWKDMKDRKKEYPLGRIGIVKNSISTKHIKMVKIEFEDKGAMLGIFPLSVLEKAEGDERKDI
jgi:hypothetical protein